MTKVLARMDLAGNVRLTKALHHPLRVAIMQKFEEPPAEGKKVREWSPSDLSTELGAPLGNVSYHVRTLTELGFLKIGRRVTRRGAVEHYYVKKAGSPWEGLPDGAEVEVDLSALRNFMMLTQTQEPNTKVGLAVDGDELLLAAGGARYRVYPDGTLTNDTNGASDGDE